jgi:hypothetical protein
MENALRNQVTKVEPSYVLRRKKEDPVLRVNELDLDSKITSATEFKVDLN